MRISKWWRKRSYWQRGAIIGGIIGGLALPLFAVIQTTFPNSFLDLSLKFFYIPYGIFLLLFASLTHSWFGGLIFSIIGTIILYAIIGAIIGTIINKIKK